MANCWKENQTKRKHRINKLIINIHVTLQLTLRSGIFRNLVVTSSNNDVHASRWCSFCSERKYSRASLHTAMSRDSTSFQSSCLHSSEYIFSRILKTHASDCVSCFNRLGFTDPLKPDFQSKFLCSRFWLKFFANRWLSMRRSTNFIRWAVFRKVYIPCSSRWHSLCSLIEITEALPLWFKSAVASARVSASSFFDVAG